MNNKTKSKDKKTTVFIPFKKSIGERIMLFVKKELNAKPKK